jgi:prepilin-type N-terminal cleavage/methylation domain-containing protein
MLNAGNNVLSDNGFTLLETIVTIAIAALALSALLPVFSDSYGRTNITDKRRLALELASNLFNETMAERAWRGESAREGDTDDYDWSIETSREDNDSQNSSAGYPIQILITIKDKTETIEIMEFQRIVWVYPPL